MTTAEFAHAEGYQEGRADMLSRSNAAVDRARMLQAQAEAAETAATERAEAAEAKVARLQRPLGRLGRLLETVEGECATDEGECHGHDLTDAGACALATDLREIYAELGGVHG